MAPDPATVEDLRYVKRALERDRQAPFPRSIAILWAAICAAGFVLNDVAPQRAGLFWGIASPAGFLLSCWLGYRAARAGGTLDRREGARWALHFATLLAAMAAAAVGVALRAFTGAQMGAVALIVCGVVFLLAGLHLARPLAWVGAFALAALPAVLLLERGRWTIAGALLASALLTAGRVGGRRKPDAAS